MRTIYLLFLSAIGALLSVSCYEDKGNYDYHEINDVKIGQMADKTQYTNIDVLTIDPDISYKLNPTGSYEYEWSARSLASSTTGETNPDIVIGKEKKLNYPVTLPVGKYAVTLRVTDSDNGLVWSNRFNLTVASATYKGWMVLCNENGRARLDMAEESGEEPLYSRDILAEYLPDKKDPKSIEFFSVDLGGNYDILMMTGDGCSRLVPEDLSWNKQEDFPYMMADPKSGNIKAQTVGWYPVTGALLIGDNNAYWRANQGGALFGVPVNRIGGKLIKLAPYVGFTVWQWFGTNFILFDQDNHRFVRYVARNAASEYWDDYPKGKELVFMQNTSNNSTYAVLKDPSNGAYSFFSFNPSSLEASGETSIDIPSIENVKAFAFDPYNNYMFFTDGQQLSLYNWSANDPSKKITTVDLFDGQKITMLKYKPGSAGNYEDYLLVATEDASGKGTLHLLEVAANRVVTEFKQYTGFGKIVDVAYRDRY